MYVRVYLRTYVSTYLLTSSLRNVRVPLLWVICLTLYAFHVRTCVYGPRIVQMALTVSASAVMCAFISCVRAVSPWRASKRDVRASVLAQVQTCLRFCVYARAHLRTYPARTCVPTQCDGWVSMCTKPAVSLHMRYVRARARTHEQPSASQHARTQSTHVRTHAHKHAGTCVRTYVRARGRMYVRTYCAPAYVLNTCTQSGHQYTAVEHARCRCARTRAQRYWRLNWKRAPEERSWLAMPWHLPVGSPVLENILECFRTATFGDRCLYLTYRQVVKWAEETVDKEASVPLDTAPTLSSCVCVCVCVCVDPPGR